MEKTGNRKQWQYAARGFSGMLLVLCLTLWTACGPDGDRFRLEGRLRNINQGEFWVYSPEGAADGIDTIPVREGRFKYETELRTPATFVVIFPNYSELPVFAKPGTTVSIKGDVTHLKEVEIKGTTENELMTKLRMEQNKLMPPEIPAAVAAFVRKHPESAVSNYLLQRYFIQEVKPDYKLAYELATLMAKKQPENGRLLACKKQLEGLRAGALKSKLPAFTATDVKGKKVTQEQLKSKVNVVTAWATWSYQSTDMQRRLQKLKKQHGDKLSIVSICLDGRTADCKQRIERDSMSWPTVCSGQMWQTPLLSKLGLADVPSNIVADGKGVILERDLAPQALQDKLEKLLK